MRNVPVPRRTSQETEIVTLTFCFAALTEQDCM